MVIKCDNMGFRESDYKKYQIIQKYCLLVQLQRVNHNFEHEDGHIKHLHIK